MKRSNNMKTTLKLGLLVSTLALAAGPAAAEVYNLCAVQTTKTLPDTSTVPMWGYALDDDGDLSNGCSNPVTIPGPRLTVTTGTLTINLRNDLSEPTSIVIPGLPMPDSGAPGSDGNGPTWNDGTAGLRDPLAVPPQRVRSFGAEAAPAGGIESYSFTVGRPGSFIYHSGTHPQKQVYMGLYGAATKDSAAGEAYPSIGTSPAVTYDNEVVLFYSEIDPDLNNAIAGSSYMTSIHYHPRWFMVNGEPYVDGMADITTGTGGAPLVAGEAVLVRFLSAAGKTHVPVLQGQHMTIHAEDGLQYNYQDGANVVAAAPREQYSAMLPPLKTKDAIVQAPAAGRYAVYDGNGYMTNPTDPEDITVGDEVGGMLRFLAFSEPEPDQDGDGVPDSSDLCPDTPAGEPVNADGCSASQLDSDGDGVSDAVDNCPLIANPGQEDKDGNGVGDACEPPQLTSFWSNGDEVVGATISMFVFGDYFDMATGATQVYVNGIQQFLVQAVTTEMLIVRVTVTSEMIGGPVTVTTSNGSAVSSTNFGDTLPGLQITGVWPSTVTEGVNASVFVFGSEFDLAPGATEVYMNGIRQYFVAVVSPEMLIVRITPTLAMTGPVEVRTPAGGSAFSSTSLVVVPAP